MCEMMHSEVLPSWMNFSGYTDISLMAKHTTLFHFAKLLRLDADESTGANKPMQDINNETKVQDGHQVQQLLRQMQWAQPKFCTIISLKLRHWRAHGLYPEGRFNGGVLALWVWGSCIWRGLFSYFLGISHNNDACIKLLGNLGKSPINNFGLVWISVLKRLG